MRKVRSLLKRNLDRGLSMFRSAILQKIFFVILDMVALDFHVARDSCSGAC